MPSIITAEPIWVPLYASSTARVGGPSVVIVADAHSTDAAGDSSTPHRVRLTAQLWQPNAATCVSCSAELYAADVCGARADDHRAAPCAIKSVSVEAISCQVPSAAAVAVGWVCSCGQVCLFVCVCVLEGARLRWVCEPALSRHAVTHGDAAADDEGARLQPAAFTSLRVLEVAVQPGDSCDHAAVPEPAACVCVCVCVFGHMRSRAGRDRVQIAAHTSAQLHIRFVYAAGGLTSLTVRHGQWPHPASTHTHTHTHTHTEIHAHMPQDDEAAEARSEHVTQHNHPVWHVWRHAEVAPGPRARLWGRTYGQTLHAARTLPWAAGEVPGIVAVFAASDIVSVVRATLDGHVHGHASVRIASGDVVWLRVWMQHAAAPDESGHCTLRIIAQTRPRVSFQPSVIEDSLRAVATRSPLREAGVSLTEHTPDALPVPIIRHSVLNQVLGDMALHSRSKTKASPATGIAPIASEDTDADVLELPAPSAAAAHTPVLDRLLSDVRNIPFQENDEPASSVAPLPSSARMHNALSSSASGAVVLMIGQLSPRDTHSSLTIQASLPTPIFGGQPLAAITPDHAVVVVRTMPQIDLDASSHTPRIHDTLHFAAIHVRNGRLVRDETLDTMVSLPPADVTAQLALLAMPASGRDACMGVELALLIAPDRPLVFSVPHHIAHVASLVALDAPRPAMSAAGALRGSREQQPDADADEGGEPALDAQPGSTTVATRALTAAAASLSFAALLLARAADGDASVDVRGVAATIACAEAAAARALPHLTRGSSQPEH